MTEAQPTLAHGDEYVVIYSGGPNDGQIETRISTDGGFDSEITVLTAIGGKETLTDYTLAGFTEVGDKYHVTYAFDAKDSEPFDAPEDRGDRQ
jgi:hypothetical protein